MRLTSSIVLAAAMASAIFMGPASAQQPWPTRPIKLVVPFVAGGAADIIARTFADQAGAALGQSMVVENIGGAGGNIAASSVVRSTPDGYTLFFASTGPAAMNTLMYKNMTFDPRKDFTPIGLVGKTPIIIAARLDAPVSTLKELIDYAGKNPETLTAGFPGSGTLGHITGVLFGQRAKVDIKHLQYRGGGPIIADLLGGHVDLAMDALTPYVAQVQEGKLRGLAVTTATRVKQLPDVPTVAEAGLPGFDASVWYCLLGPANLPPAVTAKLNDVASAFVKSAKTEVLFDKLAVIPATSTPDELRAFIVKEIDAWEPVIKSAKISF